MSRKKIGLALGGGAARGWAHIGVIEALEDCGLEIGCVAGTSIGALVGSVYASDNLEAFKKAVLNIDKKKIVSLLDVVFPKCGLLDGKKVMDFLNNYISGPDISDLSLPFGAVATDLQTSEEIQLVEGDVSTAVRASIAVPGLFTPVMIEQKLTVDGGLVNPLPVSMARSMGADIVIGVDLNYYLAARLSNYNTGTQCSQWQEESSAEQGPGLDEKQESNGFFPGLMNRFDKIEIPWFESLKNWKSRAAGPNIFDIVFASTLIMEKTITELKLENEPADVLIRPELGNIRFMDFHRGSESIREGYDSCMAAIVSNKKALNLLGISREKARELKSNISFQD